MTELSDTLHYTACGLDDVYLLNGFTHETVDGEEFITIQDLEGLWKTIGRHLVMQRKALAPKQARFLREHMNLTQAELGAKLRVSDQTVARWEKGENHISGPADLMLRVLFLACRIAQPEGGKILDRILQMLEQFEGDDDEPASRPVAFRRDERRWSEERGAGNHAKAQASASG